MERDWCCFYDARPQGYWRRYVARELTEREARDMAARPDIRRPYFARYT